MRDVKGLSDDVVPYSVMRTENDGMVRDGAPGGAPEYDEGFKAGV